MMTAGPDITSVYHAAKTVRFYNEHVQRRHTPRAVLFDLDDTLFDHEHASRHALRRVHESHTAFSVWQFEAFEREHSAVLDLPPLGVVLLQRVKPRATRTRRAQTGGRG